MKIKTFFKTLFCVGLVLTLVLYLFHLYGNYIEKTQKPVADYTLTDIGKRLTIRGRM